jgi:hypothetical protein
MRNGTVQGAALKRLNLFVIHGGNLPATAEALRDLFARDLHHRLRHSSARAPNGMVDHAPNPFSVVIDTIGASTASKTEDHGRTSRPASKRNSENGCN